MNMFSVFAIVTSVLALTYIFSDMQIKNRELTTNEVIANKKLEIVSDSVENDRELQERKSDFENELLKRQVESDRLEQERKDRRLEYETKIYTQQIELLRLEQERSNRKLEHEANTGDRLLKIQERKQDLSEKVDSETRKWIDDLMR